MLLVPKQFINVLSIHSFSWPKPCQASSMYNSDVRTLRDWVWFAWWGLQCYWDWSSALGHKFSSSKSLSWAWSGCHSEFSGTDVSYEVRMNCVRERDCARACVRACVIQRQGTSVPRAGDCFDCVASALGKKSLASSLTHSWKLGTCITQKTCVQSFMTFLWCTLLHPHTHTPGLALGVWRKRVANSVSTLSQTRSQFVQLIGGGLRILKGAYAWL